MCAPSQAKQAGHAGEEAAKPDARWTFPGNVPEAIRDYLASGRWRRDAVQIKGNVRRRVYRCAPEGIGMSIYLKEDIASGPLDRLKNLFYLKAKDEYSALGHCREAGIAAPTPLGWARTEQGGLLATAESPGRTLKEILLADDGLARLRQPLFLVSLARFANRLIKAGVWHPDLHGGNVLVDDASGTPAFALCDLYNCRVRPVLGAKERDREFAWLVPLLENLQPGERRRFLVEATAGLDISAKQWWGRLERAWSRMRKDKWHGRKQRLLDGSSICQRLEDAEGTLLATVSSPTEQQAIRQAIAAYERRDPDTVIMLKEDRKRQVARVTVGERCFVVKEYVRRFGRVAWWSPDRRGWLLGNRFHFMTHVGVPYLGWWRGRSTGGKLVLADAGPSNLHDWLRRPGIQAADRQVWLRQAAAMLAVIHLRGCFHADLKLANWVVGPRLRIVDCDDVRFYRVLPEWARLRNLNQLARSCPPSVGRREKLQFLTRYGRLAHLEKAHLRRLAEQFEA